MAGTTTDVTAVNLFVKTWSPTLKLESNEEKVVTREFASGESEGKMRDGLYIRKIARVPANTQAAGATGKGLTYSNNTEERVVALPVWAYSAVEIARPVYNRMEISPDNSYRKQLSAGLGTSIDVAGAALAAGLTTNVLGSGAVNVSRALLQATVAAIVTSARGAVKIGQTPIYLKLHPSQIVHYMALNELMADYARGDGERPIVSGWANKALGLHVDESGNVYQAGGVSYNLAYVDDAFVQAYNEEPEVLDPQDFELVKRIIATTEHGQCELWDAYGALMQTAA